MDNKTHTSKALFGWFLSNYVKKHYVALIFAGTFLAIEGAALGALSYMVRPMFDDVFVAGNREAVYWVAFVICSIFLARAVAGFTQQAILARVTRHVSADLQGDLVAHMLRLDSAFFMAHPPGKLMERVRGDTLAAVEIVNQMFSSVGRDLTGLVSLLAVALATDWQWTLFALLGAPLIVLPVLFLQRLIRRLTRSSLEYAARVTTIMDEAFHGTDTIKLHGIEDIETEKARDTISTQSDVTASAKIAQAGVPALMDVVAAIGFFGVLAFGGMQIIDGEKTVGDFMAFFTAIALLFEPMRRLGNLSGIWQKAHVSLERVYSVFEEKALIASPAAPVAIPDLRSADLALNDVTFGYGEGPILKELSLVAKAGQTTALVGPSGAGKTTVFKLVSRLVDPDLGTISLGGTNIGDLDLSELRSQLSVVTQDALMFDDTIRANICLGLSPSENEIARIISAANLSEFVDRLPDGLETRVGPRGSALSGGQRQRVAIARALLRDTPILLLDEATSALDANSEAKVQAALDSLSRDRTTIVIAHRLATIRKADQIIVMDGGRVVDAGTHEQLIERDGLYAQLCQIQFQS
jgi:ABC-type multidrug transport system fused ATPase/permease subunit